MNHHWGVAHGEAFSNSVLFALASYVWTALGLVSLARLRRLVGWRLFVFLCLPVVELAFSAGKHLSQSLQKILYERKEQRVLERELLFFF